MLHTIDIIFLLPMLSILHSLPPTSLHELYLSLLATSQTHTLLSTDRPFSSIASTPPYCSLFRPKQVQFSSITYTTPKK
ncbi:MAG: hypothetical protein J3R72DRAFT_430141 [Linnemannia gamsii]|nr:MAG: hypothetical protein J3R72DRAFT_430141 [Linnemannia gamsii]